MKFFYGIKVRLLPINMDEFYQSIKACVRYFLKIHYTSDLIT